MSRLEALLRSIEVVPLQNWAGDKGLVKRRSGWNRRSCGGRQSGRSELLLALIEGEQKLVDACREYEFKQSEVEERSGWTCSSSRVSAD